MGSFGAKAASKFGSGAAKVGKKAAQSEAGRKASKAAIRGASDSIRDDMMSRFDDPQSPASPISKSAASPTAKTSSAGESSSKATQQHNSVPSWMDDKDDSSYSQSHSSNTSSSAPRFTGGAPPKPSLLGKFKLNVNKSNTKQAPKRPVQRHSREKVYKQRLAKSADWDRLPLAQALYNFKGKMKCDLEFRKGQMIKVMTRTDNQFDWWEGKIDDRVGIFPANYVKMV